MLDVADAGLAPRPDHVPADRVRDFDLYNRMIYNATIGIGPNPC